MSAAVQANDEPRSDTRPPPARQGIFSGHIAALDGVRGLAILLVLLLHLVGSVRPVNVFEAVLVRLCGYGVYGVDLFFVLSGFLITGILYDAKLKPGYFKNFYSRRVLRIFPLYYGVLAVLFLALPWIPWFQGKALNDMMAAQFWAWTYMMNVFVARVGSWSLPYITHFWSLAVEEHFYLVWPFVVFYAGRASMLKICMVAIGSACLLRMALYGSEVNELAPYTLTPCRLDGLALGAFLAVLVRGPEDPEVSLRRLRKIAWSFFIIGSVYLVASFTFNSFTALGRSILKPLRETAFVCLCAGILITAITAKARAPAKAFFTSAPMTFLGKYSYGLYVFHAMISAYFEEHKVFDQLLGWLPHHTLALFAQAVLGFGLSILAALLSYHLYEKRFLALRTRFGGK